jgi:putative cell wall-binding protein
VAVSLDVEQSLHAYSADVKRLAGADRYLTAVAVADDAFPAPTPYVFLATGLDFPDALSVDAIAGAAGSPVLLVPKTCIPAAVNADIDRLNPGHLVIVGGPAVVTSAVDQRTVCSG